MSSARGRIECLAAATLFALALWPLATTTLPPAMDQPQHVALVDVLVRLWQNAPEIQQNYFFSLQPVGYHLFYALCCPLALVFGAPLAMQMVLIATLIAHVVVCRWAFRRTLGPILPLVAAVHTFYCALFTYGFVVTQVAAPFVLAIATLLARGAAKTKHAVALGVFAACAALGHVVFVPLVILMALCSWARYGRTMMVAALVTLGVSSAAILPGALLRFGSVRAADARPKITFDGAYGGLRHLSKFTYGIDQNIAQAGYVAFIAVMFVITLLFWRRLFVREQQLWLAYLGLVFASVWFIPYQTDGSVGSSLLLNVRWLCLVPSVAALSAKGAIEALSPQRKKALNAVCYASGVFVIVGVMRLANLYNDEVQPFVQAAHKIPMGARMCAANDLGDPVELGTPWPRVRYNMSLLAFAGRLSFHNGLFDDGHLPIRSRSSDMKMRTEEVTHAFRDAILERVLTDEVTAELWAYCDVVFLQGTKVDELLPSLSFGDLIGFGRGWRLAARPGVVRTK